MKKRRGSILIECIVSIFIITILFGVFVKMNKLDLKSFNVREASRENNIILNNIINEVKFNTSINEIDKIFDSFGESVFIDLYSVDRLKDESILSLISSSHNNEFIKISKEYKNDIEIKMVVSLIIEEDVFLETEILKEYWMEL
ncbi:hypothetical protein [Clostridium sp. Ade.TY]|uniref:type II secretion system protein n=1 Tax=Clostridium sp. Ade.TY TaxID=1391647 RepID=UPI0004675FD2|nr:hypothetical protein [Clostridium sp. Ade.TY]